MNFSPNPADFPAATEDRSPDSWQTRLANAPLCRSRLTFPHPAFGPFGPGQTSHFGLGLRLLVTAHP